MPGLPGRDFGLADLAGAGLFGGTAASCRPAAGAAAGAPLDILRTGHSSPGVAFVPSAVGDIAAPAAAGAGALARASRPSRYLLPARPWRLAVRLPWVAVRRLAGSLDALATGVNSRGIFYRDQSGFQCGSRHDRRGGCPFGGWSRRPRLGGDPRRGEYRGSQCSGASE